MASLGLFSALYTDVYISMETFWRQTHKNLQSWMPVLGPSFCAAISQLPFSLSLGFSGTAAIAGIAFLLLPDG